ncbi:sugar ABC transporter substrate-binding protein [Paenibacillus sp. CGMCC 1.16610]|uniref:Extracellular solute-binding protein n=1 Tax=Paenibacillus anseongense TaxID=2682845 RepID=A0ABW9UH93_9BACL|nr:MULTISPECIES: sugar ABC transporter substrate-binding protein [Paenibacillus]MBA2939899.1 sugar ABC transporter substrate-binding protein [Paenibacillus sp. CGMCC 1.16610]MVQ39559.1 extracellular solute-binding protein [Paenibacillus anseongense]
MKRWMCTLATIAVTASLTGCNFSEKASGSSREAGSLKKLGKDEKATIKVLYYDKTSFYQQYGNLFMAKYPNIDVEVISNQGIYGAGKDPQEALIHLIDEEKPDVLLLNGSDQLEKFAQQGRLYALDDVIKQDKFDVEHILPATLDSIRLKGEGKLYGLSPDFYSQALYYNKDLFEQYGIEFPKNKMSWEEAMNLAKRFPTDGQGDQRIYGFSAYSYMGEGVAYQYMNSIGTTLGLSFIDPEQMKLTIQTDAWKKALQLTVDSLKSGALYAPKSQTDSNAPRMYEDYLKQNLFAMGKVAMTIDGNYMIQTLQQAKDVLKDVKPVNWDIVTVPVDPQNPDFSNTVSVSNVFGINAQSPNTRAAWEFIKYINSDEFARVMSKSSSSLMTRTTYSKDKDGHNLEAFYLLKPNPDKNYTGLEKIPSSFYQPFTLLANQEIQAVIDGKKSADEALKTIQDKGQEQLVQAKQADDALKESQSKSK